MGVKFKKLYMCAYAHARAYKGCRWFGSGVFLFPFLSQTVKR